MKDALVKLADYFDKDELFFCANVVDSLLKYSQEEDVLRKPDLNSNAISFSNGLDELIIVDISNPLISQLIKVITSLFNMSMSETGSVEIPPPDVDMMSLRAIGPEDDAVPSKGSVSTSELNKLFTQALSLSGELKPTQKGQEPVTPEEFADLVNSVVEHVYKKMFPQGDDSSLDKKHLKGVIDEFLKIPYGDFYLDSYLGRQTTEVDFPARSDGGPVDTPISDDARKILYRDNDIEMQKLKYHTLDRQKNPESDRLYKERARREVLETQPKEWHQALLPPE